MTSRDAYINFLDLANKLNSNDDINIDIGRFVMLYNKNAKVWFANKLLKNKGNSQITELQSLVVSNLKLPKKSISKEFVEFELPSNWYEHASAFAICSNTTCSDKLINCNEVKIQNKRLLLFDDNWRPSFDFEWCPIIYSQNTAQVYYKDFTVEDLYIDYYRYPKDIDIAGYIKTDNVTMSTDIDPDLEDIYVNEIIDLVVADVSRIYQNNEKVQMDLNRVQQDK